VHRLDPIRPGRAGPEQLLPTEAGDLPAAVAFARRRLGRRACARRLARPDRPLGAHVGPLYRFRLLARAPADRIAPGPPAPPFPTVESAHAVFAFLHHDRAGDRRAYAAWRGRDAERFVHYVRVKHGGSSTANASRRAALRCRPAAGAYAPDALLAREARGVPVSSCSCRRIRCSTPTPAVHHEPFPNARPRRARGGRPPRRRRTDWRRAMPPAAFSTCT
jgi:hypothetical protein